MKGARMSGELSYEGKRVIITGAASGMGKAIARLVGELGGEIYALDVKQVGVPVREYVETDLSDRASIDAAVQRIGGRVDALFTGQVVPQMPPQH